MSPRRLRRLATGARDAEALRARVRLALRAAMELRCECIVSGGEPPCARCRVVLALMG